MPRVRVETDARICLAIFLDRPEKRHALDEPFLTELLEAADAAFAQTASSSNGRLPRSYAQPISTNGPT
jgi:enoyl-CoA hydratase/carnithine racemase